MEQEITREYIEQLNDIEPCCFENDREEQWFSIGLKYGLDIADSNPKSPWISVEDDLPCNHDELFINDDKKETKTVLSIINGYIMMSRMYKPKHKWRWDSEEQPTHWFPIPELPKEFNKL